MKRENRETKHYLFDVIYYEPNNTENHKEIKNMKLPHFLWTHKIHKKIHNKKWEQIKVIPGIEILILFYLILIHLLPLNKESYF